MPVETNHFIRSPCQKFSPQTETKARHTDIAKTVLYILLLLMSETSARIKCINK